LNSPRGESAAVVLGHAAGITLSAVASYALSARAMRLMPSCKFFIEVAYDKRK